MFKSKKAFAIIALCAALLIGLPHILHAAAAETEPNDNMGEANPLARGIPFSGQLSSCDDEDWFSVTTTGADIIRIITNNKSYLYGNTFTCYGDYLKISVYDAQNSTLASIVSLYCGKDFNVGVATAGTYYIVIAPNPDYSDPCDDYVTQPYTLMATWTATVPNTTTSIPGGTTTTTIPVQTIKVDFVGSPTYGQVPLLVNFTSFSTDNVSEYEWDFGDKGTSSEKNPSHLYSLEGTYTVSLRGSGNGQEDDEVKIGYITVKRTVPTTTSTITPTTTTVPKGGGCPATTVMGQDNPHLNTLRAFRNNMFINSSTGKYYTALYYRHALELSYIFTHNTELKNKMHTFLQSIIPTVENILAKREGVIDEDTVQGSIDLIDALQTQASPKLEKDLTSLKQDIQNGVIFKTLGMKIQKN